jgi:1-acyl-sn-glycerol-3-phosphate acyltransferase
VSDLPSLSERMPRMPREHLRGFERISVPVLDWLNSNRAAKNFVQFFVRHWTATWISAFGSRRWDLRGLEQLQGFRPPRGVILVSNHRSFFDMYLCCAVLYKNTQLLDRLMFPVRSKFFYDNPLGLLVNLSISGGAMWPPVFRDDRKTALNPIGTTQVHYALQEPGCILGYHPEGTRNKGPDPYEMLPTKPGLGRILKAAHPDTLIVPYWILGMGQDFLKELAYSVSPPGPEVEIRMTFGAPIYVRDLQDREGRSALDLSEEIVGKLKELGASDRQRRIDRGLLPAPGDAA